MGAGGLHPRPAGGGRRGARPLFPRRAPPVRVAALARFRGDRRDPGDHPADPRPLCPGPDFRPRLRRQARPRRNPRDRVLRPDPPAHPRRPRAGAAGAGDARRAGRARRRPGGSRREAADDLADSLPAAAHGRAPAADGRRPPDPRSARPTRRRSTMSPGCTASPRAGRCSTCSRRRSRRCGALYDGLAGQGEERVPLNPERLEAHLAARRLRRSGRRRGCGSRAGAAARRARFAPPPPARRSRRCCRC